VLGLPDHIRACLFDLDGVLTDTAGVHRTAWRAMFDEFLIGHGQHRGFDDADYLTYVDGKTRADGVRSFLASRGITLAEGSRDDGPGSETVYGLANRKNQLFLERMRTDGVEVFEGSRRYLKAVADSELSVAVVSSSANTREVLDLTGLASYVDCRVDGVTIAAENLNGKPAPDPYLYAAGQLGVVPADAAVFEDALSGVQSGRAGNFGVIVGVNRMGDPKDLIDNGADIVVDDLAELLDC
jgi:beta-phosphoglucomutase family hydrolase